MIQADQFDEKRDLLARLIGMSQAQVIEVWKDVSGGRIGHDPFRDPQTRATLKKGDQVARILAFPLADVAASIARVTGAPAPAPAPTPPTMPKEAPPVLATAEPQPPLPIAPVAPVAVAQPAPSPEAIANLGAAIAALVQQGPLDEAKVRAIAQDVATEATTEMRRALEQAVKDLAERAPIKLEVKVGGVVRGTVDGAHKLLPDVLALMAQGEFVALSGPAGCGKSVLGTQVFQALQLRTMATVSLQGDVHRGDLLGSLMPFSADKVERFIPAPFLDCFEHGGLAVLGEMDAADPNILLAINTALANGYLDVPARVAAGLPARVDMNPAFFCLADMNTTGGGATATYSGRNALDGATLDRFALLTVDYDHAYELSLATNDVEREIVEWVHGVRARARDAKSTRIVSTRMVIRGIRASRAGFSFRKVQSLLLAAWSENERAQVKG